MAHKQRVCCVLGILIAWHCGGVSGQADHLLDLIKYLKNSKNKFDPLITPKLNPADKISIRMDAMLSQIAAVNTAKQTIRISALLQAQWDEERLVWDERVFGGVSIVNWEASQIWSPTIMIYNGMGDNQILNLQVPLSLKSLTPNSTVVTALWRREFEFSCNFEVKEFPIDTHTCEISFCFIDPDRGNNLIYPELNSVKPYNSLAVYQNNSEWALLNFSKFAEFRQYPLIEGLRPIAIPTYGWKLTICRLSNYYFVNIIAPLILLTTLQVLVYFVPVESGEKLGFGITIMLSYTVFLLLLDGILPKSQTQPAVALFITSAMAMSTASLLLTSLVMRLHFTPQGTHMPACVQVLLVRCLGRLLCVSGAAAQTAQMCPETSHVCVRKSDGTAPIRSDWNVAAKVIERLLVTLGAAVTAAILVVFIIAPYWYSNRHC